MFYSAYVRGSRSWSDFNYITLRQVKRQADSAEAQLKVSTDSFRVDERAWLGLDSITGTFQAGRKIDILVNFKNSGKTPAINMNSISGAEFVPRDVSPRFSEPVERPFHVGTRPPAATIGFVFSDFTLHPALPSALDRRLKFVIATEPVISLIETGSVRLYVHGRVNYADIFGRAHWTTWCTYIQEGIHATNQFAACESHNDTDDSKNGK